MKIKFLGAAGNVTGSRFILETQGHTLLIDCGLYQERELRERNWEQFPHNPAQIDSMLLTHAHIDHCGYLPKFLREGFGGKIYCTSPTADITKVSLLDSAKIHEIDAEYKRKRHHKEGRQGRYPEQPLYTVDAAKKVFPRLRKVAYQKPFPLNSGITVTFFEAGHILGAAMIQVDVQENGATKTIIFSGDIGRWDRPILKDPHRFEKADYVVMEATYGDRLHSDETSSMRKFEAIINETAQKGGKIIIPSFAIGRTQELLYILNHLINEKKIPPLPTYVDSPMAMKITKIFEEYPGDFDEEATEHLSLDEELFDFPQLSFTPTSNESKAINRVNGPAIILAGSGMCTGGRIKHHLIQNITRPESTLLFVGYQAQGTLGRTLLERPQEARILGQTYAVRARIEKINGFSAHADQGELLRWFNGFKNKPQKIFIVHAESHCAQSLKDCLSGQFTGEIFIPAYMDEYNL